MTDPEFKAELAKRLRVYFLLLDRDCTDDEVIQFAKHTLAYAWIALQIRCTDLRDVIWSEIRARLPRCSSDRTELNRYRELHSTLLAENACLKRRNRALRGEIKALRREDG